MNNNKLHVRSGDYVEVIAGKDKGKRGKILGVEPERSRVIVEGVNIVKRHTKPSRQNTQGGIIEKPAPIHSSNVLLYCKQCEKGVRTGKKFLDDGEKVRYCKKCGEVFEQ